MEEVMSFLTDATPSSARVKKLRGPLTGGHRVTKEDTTNELSRSENHRNSVLAEGTDYVREAWERERQLYMASNNMNVKREDKDSRRGGLNSLEHLTSCGASEKEMETLTQEAMTQVYSKYSFQKREDTGSLPINQYKEIIVRKMMSYPVTVIEGPTGCGKTTQVPQWILDDHYNRQLPCKIVVTQPRKIAAISIARRVAQERGWDVGGIVGYQVGLDNKTTNDTKIHYVTTGVLLQKLVSAKNMNEYTHIILDEVHERGQEMDFLLLVVRKLVNTNSKSVKVVLMSATFNSEAFEEYFSIPGCQVPAMINVAIDRPRFSVKKFYLNNLGSFSVMVKLPPQTGHPEILPEMYHLVIKLITAFEKIDIKEENSDTLKADLPSVLIFLPGINEIEDLYAALTDRELRTRLEDATCAAYKWWVLPLHSTITADEQARVFQRAPDGHRKIILATNIAESSITVPDVKYVIDFCLIKVLVADKSTNFTSLQLKWASKNNCDQRAGRAGRVRDGRVYRLINESSYHLLPKEGEPEIIRCPLERLVLLAKMLDMGPPSGVLALAMNPPDLSNIHRTLLVLKEAGALKKTLGEEWSADDGDITYLGRIMAKLPIDVKASKLIVLGYIFGCLEESIIMAAGMSVKNIFSSPFRERLFAYNSKLAWADGSTSDCIAILNAYKVWNFLRQKTLFRRSNSNEVEWARRFFVQIRAIRELDDLVREIRMRLSREGIDPKNQTSPWNRHERPLVLKVILAGAFYPQYFVQGSANEDRERDAVKILGGLDPRNTVYLRGFPDDQPGPVYAAAIKNTVTQLIGDEPRVTFDTNSRKVFLTFQDNQPKSDEKQPQGSSRDPTIPGQVVLPVYKAIKARQLKMDIRIRLLPVEKANALAAAIEDLKKHADMNMMVPRLPDIDETHFPLEISQFITVGRFWVRVSDESTANELRMIQSALNRKPLLAYTDAAAVDTLVAAPFSDGVYYRARVTRVTSRNMVQVLFVDFGSAALVGASTLRELPAGACTETPPLAMQCALSNVAPAPLLDAHVHWSDHATRFFSELVAKGRLLGKIYSVAHGVVSIELLADGGKINVNKKLLERGFAVTCEESYDSKLNHDLRQMATELNMAQKRAFNKEQTELAYSQLLEVEPPTYRECVSDALLKGPTSPLECTLHNLMYANRDMQVQVEWNSVNSVLLDTAPQEVYERMLVAAEVGQNETTSKLTLRHTTMLPNIRGLPAIVALLFCPEAELRRDSSKTRYVSALCGLGSDETFTPRFPEHDLLVNIDADLSIDDLGLINHIRHLMDSVMISHDKAGDAVLADDDEICRSVPKSIRSDLLKLLLTRRKRREPQTVVNAWEWGSVPSDDLMEITVPEMAAQVAIFPLHSPLVLDDVKREDLLTLKRENEELKALVSRTVASSATDLVCKLCSTAPMPAHSMRIHLCSNAHLEKEEDLRPLDA